LVTISPRIVVTDKLRSYGKPIGNLAEDADHRAHKGLNNRNENSHRLTGKREKIMGRFKSLPHQSASNHKQLGNTRLRALRRKSSARPACPKRRSSSFSAWWAPCSANERGMNRAD
jgi:putative transposase